MQVVLDRRMRPQPKPAINAGGDCSACVLAGLIDREVPWVYERDNLLDRIVLEMPIWPDRDIAKWCTWGLMGVQMGDCWWRYLRMALEAGYYGIAHVHHGKGGPLHESDHLVLLCGARFRWESLKSRNGKRGVNEVLVSCSSTSTPDDEWVEANDFLPHRGGFNVVLARPVGS